jgi:hypothetical protein
MLSALPTLVIRAPINSSIAFALLGEVDFRLVFFILASAIGDLEKAITLDAYVARRVRMKRRLSGRHQNPIFAFCVSRKPGARHRR